MLKSGVFEKQQKMENNNEPASKNDLPRVIVSHINYPDKIAGCIIGFAIGDALGAPNEFSKTPRIVRGYEPSVKKGLKAGQFTDDTQHLEISLDSLLAKNGEIDLEDNAERLVRWYNSGDARSIGRTTELAIQNIKNGADYTQSGINNEKACGSLAIPRLIPYSLVSAVSAYEHKLQRGDIKRIVALTHAHKKVAQIAELFNYFIQEGMNGRSTEAAVDMIIFENDFLNKKIRRKLEKSKALAHSGMEPYQAIQEIGNSGFIEDVMFSAIYSTIKGSSFEEAVLIAANGLGDSDSRAAFAGALYGLDIGASKIPSYLKEGLERKDELEKKARQAYCMRK